MFAANKPNLFEMMRELPGSRVLEGHPGSETQAMLMPKGRAAALTFARRLLEETKAEGLVGAANETARLGGTAVAPRSGAR
ncbi:MAG TPA: hypothetical protein VNE58_12225 [Casimicrobiaceae bacterium]|nr:hypothetical protein [Casimicrobiaceae bacterium]